MTALQNAIAHHQVSITELSPDAAKELQQLLSNAGFLDSTVDGVIGSKTKAAFATFKESAWLSDPEMLWKPSLEKLIELSAEAKRPIASVESSTPVKVDRGNRIVMLGETFYSNDPIIPGGNFTWGEATHNGTRLFTEKAFLNNTIKLAKMLQPYRDKFGGTWIVTSWNRPEPFNSRYGGAKFSQHKVGAAADFNIRKDDKNYTALDMMPLMRSWAGGLGIYSGPNMKYVLHTDSRSGLARWNGSWWPN
ncbi:MAG TPA: D-Ala-D-Ala carboxypeptidase family metallohydrolase [Leptolyngbyaceae cyanobacterium]